MSEPNGVQNVNDDDVFFNDSRLFKLQTLFEFNTKKCTFCENGRKKVFAGVSDDSFYFYLMDADEIKVSKEIPWDSKKFSIIDLCFDPSGTWLLVLSMTTLQIVPVLPLLQPDVKHDLKWPTDKITTVTLNPNHAKNPTSIVWWQTKDSQQIAIIGDKAGDLIFFSLENLEIIGKTCIVGGVQKLTIFVDDSLDNITLLITSNKNRQWKLTLEQRHCQYNWVLGKKEQRKSKEINKKLDGFIASIKEMSSDKMSTLFQMKSHSVTDVPNKLTAPVSRYNPTPISLEHFQDANYSKCQAKEELTASYSGLNMSQWMLNPQSADGRHFISLFNSVHGTFTLQLDIEDHKPVFTYRLEGLPTDIQSVLWQQRIIFTFGYTVIQIHSSALASQQDSNIHTLIWEDDLDDGEQVVATWGVGNSSNFTQYTGKWTDTMEIDKLDLPRFGLDSCLVVTNKKTYLLTTRCDPCEWLVAQLVSGRRGVERTAAALKVCLQPLLLAAADILLARKATAQALPLYRLAKVSPDEPLNRFAALGMYTEMLSSGFMPQSVSTGNICFISHVLAAICNNLDDTSLINFIKINTYFSVPECLTLCADLGLWKAISTISFGKGMLWCSFQSLLYRFTSPCRGLWATLLKKQYIPFIVTEPAIPLLKYIEQYCETFDNLLLKELCIWMCPLQDCFHVIFKALATSQPNAHLSGMRRLIRTYFGVLSTLHSRTSPVIPQVLPLKNITFDETLPATENQLAIKSEDVTFKSLPITLSCGHSHWGLTYQGKACIKNAEGAVGFMNIDLDVMGKAISVSCGRHHTLLLTENGVYSLGDNLFGQLGIGQDIRFCLDSFILVGTMGYNTYPQKHSNKDYFSWHNENVTQISAGQYHSACVTDQGTLYTWGWGVHGQLAHGTIFNQFKPKKVTTLKSEKVKFVGCGACHTAILTESGKVFLCGSGAFGQIGHSHRHKCNLPFEINLGVNRVSMIAVGYFHTLALTECNEIWVWGSSPQSLRVGARGARRSRGAQRDSGDSHASEQSLPSPVPAEENPHLYPTKVNTQDIKGKIVKISAGWHHSCAIDQYGSLYVWGLNLDGQLGTGDQKEILTPTLIDPLVKPVDDKKSSPPKDISITVPVGGNASYIHNKGCNQYKLDSPVAKTFESFEMSTGNLANVACGGDFTIFLNSQGKLHIAGNSYQQFQDTTVKGGLRVVKMKNTKRILRLPNPRPAAQRMFRLFSLPNNFMEQSYSNTSSIIYNRLPNPITSLEDFKNPLWAHIVLMHLHQFVDDDTPLIDIHLRAQLASLRKDYAEALNLQLNSLLSDTPDASLSTFIKHSEDLKNNLQNRNIAQRMLLENIKKLSRNLLDSDYKAVETEVLCCQCNESDYLKDASIHQSSPKRGVVDLSSSAKTIVISTLMMLPPNSKVWTDCVNQATMFWIDHELSMHELEDVFKQVVNDGHVIDMASAIFCTNDSIDYQKHLSSVFNLDLCDSILNYW